MPIHSFCRHPTPDMSLGFRWTPMSASSQSFLAITSAPTMKTFDRDQVWFNLIFLPANPLTFNPIDLGYLPLNPITYSHKLKIFTTISSSFYCY